MRWRSLEQAIPGDDLEDTIASFVEGGRGLAGVLIS
jgi:hypothetical protein